MCSNLQVRSPFQNPVAGSYRLIGRVPLELLLQPLSISACSSIDGSPFTRRAAMTARHVSHGRVIELMLKFAALGFGSGPLRLWSVGGRISLLK
jgi:hypothetical protein